MDLLEELGLRLRLIELDSKRRLTRTEALSSFMTRSQILLLGKMLYTETYYDRELQRNYR